MLSAWFSRIFIACGLSAIVLYLMLPRGGVGQAYLYIGIQVASIAALVVGLRVNRPQKPLVWKVLLASQLVYFPANVLWYYVPIARQEALAFPSLADPLFVTSYLMMAAAVVVLIKVRSRSHDRADLVDAAIIAIGCTIALWVFQIERTFDISGLTLLAKAFTISYPLIDLLLAALLVRLVVGGGRRGLSFWLLLAGVFVQFAADISYAEVVLRGTFEYGTVLFTGWPLVFVLLGASALHPSMRQLTEVSSVRRQATLRRRLPVLAVATLVGPVILLVQDQRGADVNVPLVVVGTSIIFLLVLSRVSDLMVDVAAYQAVQKQLSRLALIVESSSDAIVGWNTDMEVTSWNAGATALYGYASEEMIGQPLTKLFRAGTVCEELAIFHRALQGEDVPSFESERVRKDGSLVEVGITLSAVRDAGDHIIGGATIARDITDLRRSQVELAAARDDALAASRLKSEFLATMSHEIRTPMNGVIGLTRLLLHTELDERQRQYAEGVQGAGEALLALINDVLDFSKIEAGRLDLEVVDFDLVPVVEGAGELLAQSAGGKGLELVAYCLPGVPTALRGDAGRLRQVLINLVSNAIKFTATGEVIVRARLLEASDATAVIRFEVSDTGIGIEEEDKARLFEPFSQADASTTRRYGGTGLGLAICVQLVAAMGGELGVDSRPQEGSTFWFTLPMERQVGAEAAPRPFHHLLEGMRVLIVDDNATNRLVLHDQLSAWDMRPDVIDNAPAALEVMRRAVGDGEPYKIALLDMCMPDMDGIELARHIGEDARLAGTKLVLVTSVDLIEPGSTAEVGISCSLTKPVRQADLYDSLMRVTAPAPEPRVASNPVVVAQGHRERILVVEDNKTNQMVALGILEHLRYQADVAVNGVEALEAMAKRSYAAVLMDCQMPEMDGFEATAEIRRIEGTGRRTPIIAMTAGVVDGAREECLASGMDDYISKPVTPEAVGDALRHWVGDEDAQPDPPAVMDGSVPAGGAVDESRLGVLRGMGPPDGSLLGRLVDAFLSEAPSSMAVLHDAIEQEDAPALQKGAHRLRGSAANLGATGMAALCGDLEALGGDHDLPEAAELLRRLEAELDLVTTGLRAAVGSV